MADIRFAPIWITPKNSSLANVSLKEGEAFSYQLSVEDASTVPVSVSDATEIELSFPATDVLLIRVNDVLLDQNRINRDGNTITLNLANLGFGSSVYIQIVKSSILEYKLIRGTLPPGLILNSSGSINGILENLGSITNIEFDFVIRVSNGTSIRDRGFNIVAEPIIREAYWVANSLPFSGNDNFGFQYYSFGDIKLNENTAISLDVSDDDLGVPQVVGKPLGMDGDFFKGLPAGLELVDNRIQGTVSRIAAPGRYLFRLGFPNQTTNEIIGEIIILNEVAQDTEAVGFQWITQEGSLGSIVETDSSDFFVRTNSPSALYFLTPASLPLPPGLRLNPHTGDIEGTASVAIRDTIYRFSIRASIGEQHIDREFAITVLNKYDGVINDVRLRIPQVEQSNMVPRYKTLIEKAHIFRETDELFGIVNDPYIPVIKGLTGDITSVLSTPSDSANNRGYHGRITVYLGKHKIAVARNASGEIIYKVLYREIIDPNALAGGFKLVDDVPIEEKVLYPQSKPNNPKYIYPRSLRNSRMDLVNKLYFPTTDVTKQKKLGTQGGEMIPTWMKSEQIQGVKESILGHIPCVVIAYLKADTIKDYASLMDADAMLPHVGKQITVDRYFLYEEQQIAATIWDENSTTFDGNEFTASYMTFDG